jgi:glutathione S-transferase
MILYGSSMSPFVRKVLAFAAEKGVDLELKPTGAPNHDPEFLEASPFKKMPGFRDGDFTLADSTAIIDYLDSVKPEPNLIPKDPKAHAKAIWFEEFADTILCATGGKMFFNRVVAPMFFGRPGDNAAADEAERTELPPIFDYLEKTIPGSGWLVEDRLTLADISVASGFVNLLHLGIEADARTHPKLAAYIAKMHARPSYAAWVEKEKAFFAKRAG